MGSKEKQGTPKVAFVFPGPLTKVPPASAGSRARKRGGPESVMIKNKRHRKVAFVFLGLLTKVPPVTIFDQKNTTRTHFVHKPMINFQTMNET